MKRKVLVTINCGNKTCDGCGWQGLTLEGVDVRECRLFTFGRCICRKDGAFHRCRACLLAEAKAKGGGK